MKLIPFLGAIALAIALSACGTLTSHDAVKVNGVALNLNANSGVTAGQFSITVDRAPRFIPKDQTQDTVTACGGIDSPDTYADLNVKATATATASPVNLAGAAAGAPAGTISAPSVALATGDVSANGCAAIIAAAATTAHPADVVATALNHTTLPAASASDIVRDGVAPK
jgi:hypothetical protein